MSLIKVVNVGPTEWFSPHFIYSDSIFSAVNFDPLKSEISLYEFCNKLKPDVLFIFRGDLVRRDLYRMRYIFQVEFSSEIYPDRLMAFDRASQTSYAKFLHCMADINPCKKIFHYDESRKGFLSLLGADIEYTCLPINNSVFGNNVGSIRDIDILFFGRASERRVRTFLKLKESGIKFVWIENGLNWPELASFICRSKVVINLTADDVDNFEPRIILGLSGGAYVFTEKSVGLDLFLRKNQNLKKYITIIKPCADDILSKFSDWSENFSQAGCYLDEIKGFDSNKKLIDILNGVI